jgi:hypothetical protein
MKATSCPDAERSRVKGPEESTAQSRGSRARRKGRRSRARKKLGAGRRLPVRSRILRLSRERGAGSEKRNTQQWPRKKGRKGQAMQSWTGLAGTAGAYVRNCRARRRNPRKFQRLRQGRHRDATWRAGVRGEVLVPFVRPAQPHIRRHGEVYNASCEPSPGAWR